jgi:superfamily II DNA or RNA helicase
MSLSQITELDLDSGKTKFYKQEVLDLYYRVLCNSNSWDLGLGFFSLSSIKLLAYPLAKFILNNSGKMRVYCNERLSENDYNIISENKVIPLNKTNVFNDLNTLYDSLKGNDQELFSQCIAFLIQTDRIEFKVLVCKDSSRGISHHKNSIFKDNNNNTVVLSGSANASEQAFIFNREDTNAFCSFWNEKSSNKTINTTINEFEKTFHEGDEDWNILEIDSKELKDKLDEIGFRKIDSLSLDKKAKSFSNSKKNLFSKSIHDEIDKEIKTINDQPHFPIFDGKISHPRPYQVDAYNAWVKNNYAGVFAMATGTGKTITSLNCLLNIFNEEKKYRAIILVPSIALLNQWEEEVNSFNFRKILKVGGGNNWEKEFSNYCSNYSWGLKEDLIIISTYGSFVLDRFQKLFKKVQKGFLLIADEAHNMGANNIKSKLSGLEVIKKIGLSATPKRIYDPEGTLAIDNFFKDKSPYTYSFGMEKALEYGFLTGYKYFPKIVELTEDEFAEYTEISKKLLKFFDFENGKFKDDPIVEILLLKRKNIIHKASNKLNLFSTIVGELIKNKKDQFVFAYIPEGNTQNAEGDRIKILNQYLRRVHRDFPKIKMNSYTSEDQNLSEILRGFEDGKIEVLFAMKMLDEGVDIPRAEVGIFASSTGNPRQFIQRRGRLLRKHKDKAFATIYDMVVVPKLDNKLGELYSIERNLVKNELTRVGYFASLSMNFYNSKETLDEVCKKYDLDLDTIINDL